MLGMRSNQGMDPSIDSINEKQEKLLEQLRKLEQLKKNTRKAQMRRDSGKRKKTPPPAKYKEGDEDLPLTDEEEKEAFSKKARSSMATGRMSLTTEEVADPFHRKGGQQSVRRSSFQTARVTPQSKRSSFGYGEGEDGEGFQDEEQGEEQTGFEQEDVEPDYLERVMGPVTKGALKKDWKENWIFPEDLDVQRQGKNALKRFEFKCKPLAVILQKNGIFQLNWALRWSHLRSAFWIMRNLAAIEYRVQKGEVEGLSVPDYAIESLFLSLQTVIGGRHYYSLQRWSLRS